MTEQPPELLPFLDRRNQKGNTVTEQPKKRKERKTVLRVVFEFDPAKFDMLTVKAWVDGLKQAGTVRSAKLTGLPTSTDLA